MEPQDAANWFLRHVQACSPSHAKLGTLKDNNHNNKDSNNNGTNNDNSTGLRLFVPGIKFSK